MNRRLSHIFKFSQAHNRKYILIAAAALLCIALIYRFLPDLNTIISPQTEIDLKERKIIKYAKMVELGRELSRNLDALNRILDKLESRLLSGKSPSLAAVEIQKMMHKITEKSGLQVKTFKVLEPEELDRKDYLSIPVDFYLYPNVRQLKEILYRIESSPMFLEVTKLTTRFHGNQERRFRCNITVAGLMKTHDPEAGANR